MVARTWLRHGASRLLAIFAVAQGRQLAGLGRQEPHGAFASFVEQAARERLRTVLPGYMVMCAERAEDPGANPPGRRISFATRCRGRPYVRFSKGCAEAWRRGVRRSWHWATWWGTRSRCWWL